MIKVISYVPKNYCNHCDSNTVECYTIYNKPIFYNNILYIRDKDVQQQRLNKYPLSYMQCTRCRRKFIIEWDDGLPTPLIDKLKLQKFITRDED